MGGAANALSIVRGLGKTGIACHAINGPQAPVKYSRFCKWIEIPSGDGALQEARPAYLLGNESEHLRGSVLPAASDEVIELS